MNCLPDSGVPFNLPDNIPYKDLHAAAKAACNTVEALKKNGLDPQPTEKDKVAAQNTLCQIADPTLNPKKEDDQTKNLPQTTASVAYLGQILGEFDKKVVQSAMQLRIYVTNKLIQETTDPDPKVRIRALELLGRISDVGLFTDRTEVTITHRSTSDLESKLREKLQKLISDTSNVVEVEGNVIDVNVELGIEEEKAVQ